MFTFKAGSTSKSVYVKLVDSSTFLAKTGLLFSDMTIYYTLAGAAAVSASPATLAAASSAWATGGFKEVDATNAPGLYRFDPPNAALATGPTCVLTFKAASTKDEALLVFLPAYDPYDTVRLGLTALPNAAAGANTGLPVVGTQVPNATAGAANGLLIAGTNAATSVSITGNITGNLSGSVGSLSGMTASDVAAIKAKTDNLPADPTSTAAQTTQFNAVPAAVLTAANASPIKANVLRVNNIVINGTGVLGDEFKP